MSVLFQGIAFPSYAYLAKRLYVSPYAGELIANIDGDTICNAIHDGRLRGHSVVTPPYAVSVEALAAWRTLRAYRAAMSSRWTVDDLIRAAYILPTTRRRLSHYIALCTQRAIRLAGERPQLNIMLMADADLPAKTAPGRPALPSGDPS